MGVVVVVVKETVKRTIERVGCPEMSSTESGESGLVFLKWPVPEVGCSGWVLGGGSLCCTCPPEVHQRTTMQQCALILYPVLQLSMW
jgi:hypothetical protein